MEKIDVGNTKQQMIYIFDDSAILAHAFDTIKEAVHHVKFLSSDSCTFHP